MKAVFGLTVWQRCQFDLAQNAIHLTPSQKIGDFYWSRAIMKRSLISPNGLKTLCQRDWLWFTLPDNHRRQLRTSNPVERGIQQEHKRRTRKVSVYPNIETIVCVFSAVLVKIDDKWVAAEKGYIK